MGYANIFNGKEQPLVGRYEIVCPHCGYVFRIAHLITDGKNPKIECDSCGKKINLNEILDTPYLREIS